MISCSKFSTWALGVLLWHHPLWCLPPNKKTETPSQKGNIASKNPKEPSKKAIKERIKEGSMIRTLSEAFQSAYVYNLEIQSAFNTVKQAQEDCFKARADWMPNLDFSMSLSANPTSGYTNSNVGTTNNVIQDAYGTKSNYRSATVNFKLGQNLYNGGATKAKNELYLEAYRATWCDFKNQVQKAFMDILNGFVEMAVKREMYLVNKMREKSLMVLREVARNRALAGDQRLVDVSLANARCISMSIDVNSSKQDFLDQKGKLEMATGGVFSEDMDFPVPLEVDLYSVDSLISMCLQSNPASKKWVHMQRQARCNVNLQGANFLPVMGFDLVGTAGDTYSITENEGFKAYPTRSSTKGFSATVEVRMPIFDGGGRAADYRKVELDYKNVRLNAEAIKRDLMRQCRQALITYQFALQNVVSAREAHKEQAAAFSSAREEYALGATSMVDLLGLEDQYVSSIRNLISALAELVRVSYDLKSLVGELTPDMVHITKKNYDIEAYREAFKMGIYSLGKNQSKTPLYEKSKEDSSVGGSDILRCQLEDPKLPVNSSLKEGIDWYPTEGITLQEHLFTSDEGADSNILQQLLSKQKVDTSVESNKNMDIEALMNSSLDELNRVSDDFIVKPEIPVAAPAA